MAAGSTNQAKRQHLLFYLLPFVLFLLHMLCFITRDPRGLPDPPGGAVLCCVLPPLVIDTAALQGVLVLFCVDLSTDGFLFFKSL